MCLRLWRGRWGDGGRQGKLRQGYRTADAICKSIEGASFVVVIHSLTSKTTVSMLTLLIPGERVGSEVVGVCEAGVEVCHMA